MFFFSGVLFVSNSSARLFQPSFFSQLLLRLFEELIVDHSVSVKFLSTTPARISSSSMIWMPS